MALQWKRNSRYPSVTRPGVFPRIQEFDETGVDVLEETWFQLTGIDEEEINKFKFSLGTWVQLSRRNRKIRILTAEQVNTVTYPITDDSDDSGTTEPKPSTAPEGFLNGKTPYEWAYAKAIEFGYDPRSGYSTDNNYSFGGKGGNVFILKPSGGDYTQRKAKDFTEVTLRFHDNDEWKPTDGDGGGYWKTRNYRLPGAGRGPYHIHKGDITKDRIWQCYRNDEKSGAVNYFYRFRANIADRIWAEDTKFEQPSEGFQWFWLPSNTKITDAQTGLSEFGDWFEGGSLIETQNQAGSNNQYVGLVTKSPIQDVLDIQPTDLFLYHEIGSDAYDEISSPLEVWFSLNFLERDTQSLDVIKYKVIEWGDENEQMDDEQIINSEFFYLYETDDSVFDGTKYKKLCLIAADAVHMDGEEINNPGETNDRGTLESHIYTEPGIKTIKTIVMRFDENGVFLLETSIVHTNIFIGDPNQTIQDFNIFGGQDFTVLPLEKKLEPIIGNVDRRSEYVRSVEKIRDNDLYEDSDYLEKLYADQFLPNVYDELYGKYAGNIDLGVTRVFKKPYDIFDFIGGDRVEIINNNFEYPQDSLPLNSSATEILISNKDCVVDFDPSDQTNAQIENKGISDEKGLLMGDYRLVKNPEQQIRREGGMATPKINTQNKKQAF